MTQPSVIQVSSRFTAILIIRVFLFSFQDKSYVVSSLWLSYDASKYLAVTLFRGIEARDIIICLKVFAVFQHLTE